MSYEWTESLSPMIGVPMLDVPAGSDVPNELHPRDSYTVELLKLYLLVAQNHSQYYLSKLNNPTLKQKLFIEKLVKLESEEFDLLFNNQDGLRVKGKIIEMHQQLKTWPNYGHASVDSIGDDDSDLREYDAQYRTISRPFTAEYMHDDDLFAYWRLAGNNPVSLFGVSTLPSNFPLTNEQYQQVMGEADSLSDALSEKRIYMLDYSSMPVAEKGYSKPATDTDSSPVVGYSYAAMALFAVSKTDNRLKSVAIQCGQDPDDSNPMFLALTDEEHRWGWERAKMVIHAADKTEHQLSSHLGLTHLLCEAFAVATIRKLTKGHPVYDLLISHFEGTNRINHNATIQLLGERQFVDTLIAAPLGDIATATIDIRLNFNFYDNFLPARLASKGVNDTTALPEYPYRDDALLIWNAISDFVSSYVKYFYVTSAQVAADSALMAWMDDLLANGKVKGLKKISTREELSEVLTMVIFTSSAQHAAVNFTQPGWMMYAPAMVGTLNYHKPTDRANSTKNEWLEMLPVLSRAMKKIDIYTLLGNLYNGYLGEYVDREGKSVFDTNDTRLMNVIKSFRTKLSEIEKTISERNKTRLIPYETLFPSKIPASINI